MDDDSLGKVAATLSSVIYEDDHNEMSVAKYFTERDFPSSSHPHLEEWKTPSYSWMEGITSCSHSPDDVEVKNGLYLSEDESILFIAFRGTMSLSNALSDVKFWQVPLCEENYKDVFVHSVR